MFKKLALSFAVALSMSVSSFNANAIGVGIATYDNTAELNAIEELSRWLTQLEDNVESLKNEATMLFNPGIEVFQDVSDQYRNLSRSVNNISSAINNANNTVNYIKEHFGDSAYWEQCVTSGCDPTNMINSAYNAVHNALDNAISMSSEIAKMSSETQAEINSVINRAGGAGSDEGINASLVRLNELQGLNSQLMSQLILLEQAQAQAQDAYLKELSARQRYEQEVRKKFFVEVEVEQVNTPLEFW